MQTISAVEPEAQASSIPEVHLEKKVGTEVVRSADVSRSHYSGPRPGRRGPEPSTRDCIAILRGQLRLLRLRAESGIFVSPDAIGRAERLANSLEVAV